MGHTVAIASSATRYQAAPIAEELGIEHVLCTRAMVRDGRLTGGLEGAPLWGTGKADAVCEFAKAHGIALLRSYGYANGNEDIAFLKSVGHATAVNPKPALLEAAQREGWKVLRFPARRKLRQRRRAQRRCLLRAGGHVARRPRLRRDDRARDAGPPNGSARPAATPCWRSPASTVEVQGEHHLLGAPAIGVPVQSSKHRRWLRAVAAAEARLHRRRQEGSGQYAAARADPARAGLCLHRPRQHPRRHRSDGSRRSIGSGSG